ncbi:MAG: hypothetical protein ACKOC8_10175 [Pirellulales bacterium]
MTLDFLDRAFLSRWDAVPAAPAAATAMPMPASADPRLPATAFEAACPAPEEPAEHDDRIDRLLDSAGLQWGQVADEIEAARRRGRRVIAFTSSDPGAGCTTLVAGLVRLLRGRGRDVVGRATTTDPTDGPSHDKRIVLVDAGIWFPPGRIHRQRLLLASTGCDAAIFVRKAGRPAPSSWGVALEAIGVEPLGEVISCVPGDAAVTAEGGLR